MRALFNAFVIATLGLVQVPSWAARDPEPLEAFELHELRISRVSLNTSCGPTAYVMDPKGYVHRVQQGDYIGKHFGWVKRVSAEGIQLRELYELTKGDWKEQEAWLRAGTVPIYPAAEPATR